MNINNPMIFVHSVDEQRVFANRQAYSDFLLEFVAKELKDFLENSDPCVWTIKLSNHTESYLSLYLKIANREITNGEVAMHLWCENDLYPSCETEWSHSSPIDIINSYQVSDEIYDQSFIKDALNAAEHQTLN